MIDLDIRPCCETDTRTRYVADGPIDFESWLELSAEMDTELIRGVMVDRMAAQYPHEWIYMWLVSILSPFVLHRKLGVLLGSRTAVRVSANDGRLPDIVFVRNANLRILEDKAIYGTPDLVIEIVSKNDRPSDLVPLEADYQAILVPEIVFIDPGKKRVRYVKYNGAHYDDVYLTTGRLEFASIPGFCIEIEWLFADEKPDPHTITKRLIEASEA